MRLFVGLFVLVVGHPVATAAPWPLDVHGRLIAPSERLAPMEALPKAVASPSGASGWTLEPFVVRATFGDADALAIGDVSKDGLRDVVLVSSEIGGQTSYVSVYRQSPAGSLLLPTSRDLGGRQTRASIALVEVDGAPGLDAVVGGSVPALRLLRNDGAGELVPDGIPLPYSAEVMVAINMDGDEFLDVASVTWASGGHIHRNQGLSAVQSQSWNAIVNGYNSMASGDLNGDGLDDVVVGSGQGVVGPRLYLNSGTGALIPWLGLSGRCPEGSGDAVVGVAIGDVNGDGLADVVASSGGNRPRSCIQVFAGSPNGEFEPPMYLSSYDIPETLRVVDIDRDRDDDIVVVHGGWNRIGVYRQNADGTMANEVLFEVPYASHYSTHGMEVADFSGDGCPDVALADYNSGLVTLRGAGCDAVFGEGFEGP